jgi:sulfur carrier protein ThiS
LIKVNVKLFATLRRHFPDYNPDKGVDVEMNEGSTVEDLLHTLHLSQNEARVIIVNGIPKKINDPINNQDQVNIFTPISGG